MTDDEVDKDPEEHAGVMGVQRPSRVVAVSSVITATATSIIALLLLYGAFAIGSAANELSEFGAELEEGMEFNPDQPSADEFGTEDEFSDDPQDLSEEPGLAGDELQAELDVLEEDFGPGPTPSAIRSTAEIQSEISDDDLRRYGLGVCFGVVFSPEQLADETGITQEEAERMVDTAEGWCSA